MPWFIGISIPIFQDSLGICSSQSTLPGGLLHFDLWGGHYRRLQRIPYLGWSTQICFGVENIWTPPASPASSATSKFLYIDCSTKIVDPVWTTCHRVITLSHHYWDDSVFDSDTSQLKQPDVPKNHRVGVLGPRSPKYVLSIAAVKGHMYV